MRERENEQQNIKTNTDHGEIQFCFVIQSDCHVSGFAHKAEMA